jgi:NitT/TauT family transport system substrate-binding protein
MIAKRNNLCPNLVLSILAVLFCSVSPAHSMSGEPTLDLMTISFATDWKAQAEQGGFYQAIAEGLYQKRGLNVQVIQGGPAVNVPALIAGGAVDMGMGSNSFIPLNLLAAGAEVKAIMSSFQKDPQVLITHARDDITTLADMRGKPIMISDATISAFWVWLRAKYQFEDTQIRKYTFNAAPFLVNPEAIQQGYLSSEPYTIEKETGVAPTVYLLADHGYPSYGAMVLAQTSWIESKPEIVQAFVDATIEGWYLYLYGDPAPGNAAIKADNPEMTDDALAQAIEKLKSYGIVDSGEALEHGIGAMTDERWRSFFETMSTNGVYDAGLSYSDAYTLEFVNKGYGLDLKSE